MTFRKSEKPNISPPMTSEQSKKQVLLNQFEKAISEATRIVSKETNIQKNKADVAAQVILDAYNSIKKEDPNLEEAMNTRYAKEATSRLGLYLEKKLNPTEKQGIFQNHVEKFKSFQSKMQGLIGSNRVKEKQQKTQENNEKFGFVVLPPKK